MRWNYSVAARRDQPLSQALTRRNAVGTSGEKGLAKRMCGRYTLSSPKQRIIDVFSIHECFEDELAPRYNAAPTQWLPIVRELEGRRRLDLLRWGLIPSWAKDPAQGDREDRKANMINARAETVAVKPAYRAAYRRRRCLVPANGLYEWRKGGFIGMEGAEGKNTKQPYFIYLTQSQAGDMDSGEHDTPLLGFAGLWEHWQGADGSEIESFTILTTTPNDLVKTIHDRMPVIIPATDYDRWLSPQISGEKVTPLLCPWPAQAMASHPVSRRVGSAQVDEASLILPVKSGSLFDAL